MRWRLAALQKKNPTRRVSAACLRRALWRRLEADVRPSFFVLIIVTIVVVPHRRHDLRPDRNRQRLRQRLRSTKIGIRITTTIIPATIPSAHLHLFAERRYR
jgi:hypothetical protein